MHYSRFLFSHFFLGAGAPYLSFSALCDWLFPHPWVGVLRVEEG